MVSHQNHSTRDDQVSPARIKVLVHAAVLPLLKNTPSLASFPLEMDVDNGFAGSIEKLANTLLFLCRAFHVIDGTNLFR